VANRRKWRLLALLGMTLLGCGGERGFAAAHPAPEPALAVDAGPGPRDEPPSWVASDPVNRALATVAELRELPATGPVKGKIIDREAMLVHVREQLRSEVPEPVVRGTNAMLFLLNVVPRDFDYEKSLLALLDAQLAGFYEPRDKTMYLLADLPEKEREATLAHELVHALQDQHYGLENLIKYRDDATDALSAIHALAEGDATSAMFDHILLAQGKRAIDLPDSMISLQTRGVVELAPSLAAVPTIVKRSVISPYVDGIELIHRLRRQGGWPAVDASWKKPPTTTEQLLHADKFAAREPALEVSIPGMPASSGFDVIYHDVLGEQSLRLLFEEWAPRRTAVEAASDWGGDRVAVFERGDRHGLAWHLRFDNEDAARRAYEALLRGVLRDELPSAGPSQGPVSVPDVDRNAATAAAKAGKACRERPNRGPIAATRRGREIALVAGPVRGAGEAARSDANCVAATAWAVAVSGSP